MEKYRHELKSRPQPDRRLWVCGGTGCLAAGGGALLEALKKAAGRPGLAGRAAYKIDLCGCLGFCEGGPLVETTPEGYLYQKVTPDDAEEIVSETLLKGREISRLAAGPAGCPTLDLPFYKPQTLLIMNRWRRIDPESLDDYLRADGYEALALALSRYSPAEVSALVEASGLRGRGGGGFPAGRKWRACREAEGETKYVLANGDEGDPGAFMNRGLMEGDPHAVIEGMLLGAYAVGASVGYIYVRHEFAPSVARLSLALTSARERGLLGPNILGSGFSCGLEIVEGGGAFVCGESSALMTSIEGRAGTPRIKYVRSTERGLWESPTLLQNVETWANVPLIVKNGPDWFKTLGSPNNPGTKVFSLVGQVRRGGLVEMPLGQPLRVLVMDVGGGAPEGRRFKAVQTGGPSGGCLPESHLDLPVDFDHLNQAGAMMGSGGVIVMDDLCCMVDVARYFIKFLVGESCGKCVPCREGLSLFAQVLDDLCSGRAEPGDTARLEEWSALLAKTALCGLGQAAPNPILSTLKYFPEEYREHEEENYCRAGRCRGMYRPVINQELCHGCGACLKACPVSAITGAEKEPHQLDEAICVTCGDCLRACRFGALSPERPRAAVV